MFPSRASAALGADHENPRPRGGDRRRRGRRRRRSIISPRRAGRDVVLVERKELTSGSTWHAAGPPAALQPLLLGRPDPQILGRPLPDARSRDRPECRLPQGLQHPPRPHPRPLGRVHVLRRRRRDDRRQGQRADAGRGQGDLAALRDRRHPRRHPASRRRLYPARRPHPGARQGRARARRRDQPQHHRHRDRAHAAPANGWSRPTRATSPASMSSRRPAISRAQTGAMVGLDVPVIPVEHQYIVTEPHPGDRRAPAAGPARDGRAARERFAPGTCARRTAACCSAPTRRARPPAMSTARRRQPNTSSSRKTSTASRRISRPRSPACPPSARSASRRSITAPSPIRPTARRSSARPGTCRISGSTKATRFGVTAAGGAGWQLAEWIVEGEPTIDMMGVDPRRFGPYATPRLSQGEERGGLFANVFTIALPGRGARRARGR